MDEIRFFSEGPFRQEQMSEALKSLQQHVNLNVRADTILHDKEVTNANYTMSLVSNDRYCYLATVVLRDVKK